MIDFCFQFEMQITLGGDVHDDDNGDSKTFR